MRCLAYGLLLFCLSQTPARAAGQHFFYLSDHRVVTVELVDERSVILYYINLGDSFEVLIAYDLVFLLEDGSTLRGHLFRDDEAEDPARRFEVSRLVPPGRFTGFVVAGRFERTAPVARALYRVGGRILELEAVEPAEFEIVAARIGELNLGNPDRRMALERSGFNRGFGRLVFSGTPEAEDYDGLFGQSDVIPPVALATPNPRLPTAEAHRPDPVVVRVSALVTRAGGLRNVTVAEGLDPRLDQIAEQTVRNSWVFLPAISHNELADAEVKLNVVFQR